jgi:hypothetical protein
MSNATVALFAPSAEAAGRLRELMPALDRHGLSAALHDCPWTKNADEASAFVDAKTCDADLSLIGVMGSQKDAERAARTIRRLLPKRRVGVLLSLEGYITWLAEMLRDREYPRMGNVAIALHVDEYPCFAGMGTILHSSKIVSMPQGIWDASAIDVAAHAICRVVPTTKALIATSPPKVVARRG